MNRTSSYPFSSLAVGNYFTVSEAFQHARVAASEYGRKNQQAYSCRMQPDGSMRVYRVASDQRTVDVRGRRGKRVIPGVVPQPTKAQFLGWLATFDAGQSFVMPDSYAQSFQLMQAWCEIYSLKTGSEFKTAIQSNGLLIARGN